MKILVTGSSGYVGGMLIPHLKSLNFSTIGVDVIASDSTDIVANIASVELKELVSEDFVVINLAATRFDYGISAATYYHSNVVTHEKFLSRLNAAGCIAFVHMGSVACFNGVNIKFEDSLGCDDAYRSTKFLQSELISEWCRQHGVRFVEIMPSAIYSDIARGDTNIGKLQSLLDIMPFIPAIDVNKSLTHLPKLCSFTTQMISDTDSRGYYLAIETPVKSLTEIMVDHSTKKKVIVRIPLLYYILMFVSGVLFVLGKITSADLKLYPSRVRKMFTDTSYDGYNIPAVNRKAYEAHS